jgi:hypothetical protein
MACPFTPLADIGRRTRHASAFLQGRLDCVAMPFRREERVSPGQRTAIMTIGVLVPDVSRHLTFAFRQSYEVKYDESLFAGARGRHRRRPARRP